MKTKAIAILAALALALPCGGCRLLAREDASGSGSASASPSNSGDVSDIPQASLYDRGLEIISQMREMAGSAEYLSLYTGDAQVQAIAAEAGLGASARPSAVYQITFPGDSALEFYQPEGGESGLSRRLRDSLREQYGSAAVFANANNATYGAATVAAFSVCTASQAFVHPGVQGNAIYLYRYTDAVPAAVSFVKGEDDTVSAFGIFVYNGADTLDGLLEQLEEAGAKVETVGS